MLIAPAVAALLPLTLALSPAVHAADPCLGASAGHPVVQDLRALVETEGQSDESWSLPPGTLTAADLERAFQALQRDDQGVMGLFAMLSDGLGRTLPGDVVRGLFDQYGVELDFLPLDALIEVVSDGSEVSFRFDFGPSGYRDIQTPASETKVLDSRHRSDPYLVHSRNRVRTQTDKGYKLRLNEEIRFMTGEHGIDGVREGDMQLNHWLAGWLNVDLKSRHAPGQVALGEKDRPVLAVDQSGEPIIRDGRYVPQRHDHWVVIKVAGREVLVGVPPLVDGTLST